MPSKYDEQTRAKAVRLVTEHVHDYDSEWAAIQAVSARLGMTTETSAPLGPPGAGRRRSRAMG